MGPAVPVVSGAGLASCPPSARSWRRWPGVIRDGTVLSRNPSRKMCTTVVSIHRGAGGSSPRNKPDAVSRPHCGGIVLHVAPLEPRANVGEGRDVAFYALYADAVEREYA